MNKVTLYANTIRYLKPEQVWHQVTKRMGFSCALIKGYKPKLCIENIREIPGLKELDYDAEFLSRFSVDELMENRITLLHSQERLDLEGNWFFENRSPLWNHNLHYFEYLFPLAKEYEISRDFIYIEKIKEYINAWIKQNPLGSKNSAWECYPIALRISNWIDLYALLRKEFNQDIDFKSVFIKSIHNQYVYLLNHLEKHLLANHYFEDLKALVIASAFFGNEEVCNVSTKELLKQCEEQILDDGMHYERSPMYQKILLEDLIRVENALEYIGKRNSGFRKYIKKMEDVVFSFEDSMERLPLFNDCGVNISKSLSALTQVIKERFGIEPTAQSVLPNSGFYIYNFGYKNEWKIIIDAGQPGPDYSPGHSHCEIMSFELFQKGKPIIVNCGTYAYQSEQRSFFKSTRAHNTVMIKEVEQSECWGSFRMARRARVCSVKRTDNKITITMVDYKNNLLQRVISISDNEIDIEDKSEGNTVVSYLHVIDNRMLNNVIVTKGICKTVRMPYAVEFGKQIEIDAIEILSNYILKYTVNLR